MPLPMDPERMSEKTIGSGSPKANGANNSARNTRLEFMLGCFMVYPT